MPRAAPRFGLIQPSAERRLTRTVMRHPVSFAMKLLGISLTLALLGCSQYEEAIVTAQAGLLVRAEPSRSAQQIGGLAFGDRVNILEEHDQIVAIDGMAGRWVYIERDGLRGWAFGAYLRRGVVHPSRWPYLALLVFAALAYFDLRRKDSSFVRKIIAEARKTLAPPARNPHDDLFEVGLAFEKFVVSLFHQTHFAFEDWTKDKKHGEIWVESNFNPDLLVRHKESQARFAIECKWRRDYYRPKRTQLSRYRNYQKKNAIPVYVVLGLGGSANAPHQLYCIPLSVIPARQLSEAFLAPYARTVSPFSWKDDRLV